MNRKLLIRIPLIILLGISIYAMIYTYGIVKKKTKVESDSQKTMVMLSPTATPTPIPTPIPTVAPTPTPTVVPVDPEKPVLTFKSDVVRVKIGESYNVISAIEDITDDKTDRWTLFRRIRIHGDYSFSTAGTYTLEYIVSDLDWNDSIPKYLTLIVEE